MDFNETNKHPEWKKVMQEELDALTKKLDLGNYNLTLG